MADLETILALPEDRWVILNRRQARETLRLVYRVDDRFAVKKFELPLACRTYRRPWVIEDQALRRLKGASAPHGYGYQERKTATHRVIWLAKDFVPGEEMRLFALEDMPNLAAAMLDVHRALIVTDDAHARNFLKRPDGSFVFIDFGRARNFIGRTPWFYANIGWELAKLYREGLRRDRTLWRAFAEAYFSGGDYGRVARRMVRGSTAGALGLRMARKVLQGKSWES